MNRAMEMLAQMLFCHTELTREAYNMRQCSITCRDSFDVGKLWINNHSCSNYLAKRRRKKNH